MSRMPDPKPPAKTPHPTIQGAALFRTKDGWRAGFIRTDDPSIFVGPLTEPNMKSITMEATKRFLVQAWEQES